MRPIHLTLSAFGSYGGVEEIAFQDKRKGLFLIAGDTGSGKSTIFDGMMFALYGELSGKERKSNMMRSEYAQEGTETWVEFTFSYQDQEGDKQYKIRRSPVYMRKSKRKNKDGKYTETKQGGTACLTLPDGKEITRLREIAEKIEEIIGLTSDQFSKIAMIAQGEFQELIMDKTGKRKEIFQKIFETGIYEQIEEEIRERFKKEEARQKESKTRMDTILEGARLPDDEKIREQWEEALKKTDTEPERMEQLQRTLLQSQKIQLQEREHKRNETQNDRNQVERIRQQKRELQRQMERARELESEREECKKRLRERRENYEKFCEVYEEEKKEQMENVYRLREQLTEYVKWDEQEKRLQKLVKLGNEHQKGWEILRSQNMVLCEEQFKLEQQGHDEEDARLEEQRLSHEMQNLAEKEERFQAGKEAFPALKCLEKEQRKAQENCIALEMSYERLRREKEELDRKYIAGQAGILASKLQPGTPCPVCGSSKHPNPCQSDSEPPVQESDREAARTKEKEMEKRRDQALADAAQLRSQYEVKTMELCRSMQEIVPDFSVENAEKRMTQLTERLEKERERLQQEWELCQRKIKEQENRKIRLRELAEEIPRNADRQKQVELEWEKIKAEKKAVQERCDSWKKELVYPSLSEAKEGLRELTERIEEWDKRKLFLTEQWELEKKKADELQGQWEESQRSQVACRKKLEEEHRKNPHISTDEEELEALDERLRVEWNGVSALYDEAKIVYETNQEIFSIWTEKKRERDITGKKYRVLQSLHDAARGKVYFQTYVQRQYFKQIIRAANQRLSKMNANQFLLSCRELGMGGQGQQGLELDVINPMNGKRRDAHTLSGGETFMASLAMALGLSDVVQSRVGATRLETMFIDEGFGSLSEDVRNMAVKVLLELADSNRLVGVVSHVTELKEQIPDKLLVTKDSKGSHVRWELD